MYTNLLTIVEFIKYTCQVEIILILISLITKGVEVQRHKINYSTHTSITGISEIDDIIIYNVYE